MSEGLIGSQFKSEASGFFEIRVAIIVGDCVSEYEGDYEWNVRCRYLVLDECYHFLASSSGLLYYRFFKAM